MTVTITRLYDDHVSAERAVRDLEAAGIPHKDISILSNNADSWYKGGRADTTAPGTPRGRIDRDHDGVDDRAEGAGTGAGIGATIGGAAASARQVADSRRDGGQPALVPDDALRSFARIRARARRGGPVASRAACSPARTARKTPLLKTGSMNPAASPTTGAGRMTGRK